MLTVTINQNYFRLPRAFARCSTEHTKVQVLRFLHMAKNRLLRVQNSIESQVGDILRQCGLAVCMCMCYIKCRAKDENLKSIKNSDYGVQCILVYPYLLCFSTCVSPNHHMEIIAWRWTVSLYGNIVSIFNGISKANRHHRRAPSVGTK